MGLRSLCDATGGPPCERGGLVLFSSHQARRVAVAAIGDSLGIISGLPLFPCAYAGGKVREGKKHWGSRLLVRRQGQKRTATVESRKLGGGVTPLAPSLSLSLSWKVGGGETCNMRCPAASLHVLRRAQWRAGGCIFPPFPANGWLGLLVGLSAPCQSVK